MPLRAADAGELGRDVRAALHVRVRRAPSEDFAQVAVAQRKHAVNNPTRLLLRQAADPRGAPERALDRRAAAALRLLPGDRRRRGLRRSRPRARARPGAAAAR